MSRWSVPTLATMTEQQVFDAAAYHLIANGGAARDLFLKPESRKFNPRRTWSYFRRQKRVPAHASKLIDDLERIHRDREPTDWISALAKLAHAYHLEFNP